MLADARCRAGIRKFQEFRRTVKSKTRLAPVPEGGQLSATLSYASRSSAETGARSRPIPDDLVVSGLNSCGGALPSVHFTPFSAGDSRPPELGSHVRRHFHRW